MPQEELRPRLVRAARPSRANGTDITNPKQGYDPTTNPPNVTFGFTGTGRTASRT